MKSGSADTHDLAVAAKAQADKMKSMSDAADKIRQAAQDMVTQDQRIADNSQKAIEASNKRSAEVLKATIDASNQDQRAWGRSERTSRCSRTGPTMETPNGVHQYGQDPG